MRYLSLVVVSLVSLLTLSLRAGAADCKSDQGAEMKPEGEMTGGLSARIVMAPATVPVGRPFSATVAICGGNGGLVERFSIDATMPQHRHGMNYKPSVTSGGDDRTYTATGLFFHMPGLWRFEVTVQSKEKRQRFTHDVIAQ